MLPLHALVTGFPGTGKTTLIAGAANMGIKILYVAIGSESPDPLILYTKPEFRSNLTILHARDELTLSDETGIEVGSRAIAQVERLLFRGKWGKGQATQEFGDPFSWTTETMVVLDGLSGLGDSAEERALALNGGLTREGNHLWRAGQQQEYIARTGRQLGCHFIMLAHLDIFGPKGETGYKDETVLQKQVKAERAKIEETGYFSMAKSVKISRNFARHFPHCLLCEVEAKDDQDLKKNPSARVVRTKPVEGFLVKCPLPVKDKLPLPEAMRILLEAQAWETRAI